MSDRIWISPVLGFSANAGFATRMAADALAAAERAGYPACEVHPPRIIDLAVSTTGTLGEKLAFEMNTLAFGLEAIERYYGIEEWCEAGLIRLRRLLNYGRKDAFGLGARGFPNTLISGHRLSGLMAHGSTVERRRESRRDITRFLRDNYTLVTRGCDGVDGLARVRVLSNTMHGNNPGRFAVSMRFRNPFDLLRVTWDDRDLGPDMEHGFRLRKAKRIAQLTVSLQAPLGGMERRLEVRYRSPYLGTISE